MHRWLQRGSLTAGLTDGLLQAGVPRPGSSPNLGMSAAPTATTKKSLFLTESLSDLERQGRVRPVNPLALSLHFSLSPHPARCLCNTMRRSSACVCACCHFFPISLPYGISFPIFATTPLPFEYQTFLSNLPSQPSLLSPTTRYLHTSPPVPPRQQRSYAGAWRCWCGGC